MATSLYLDTARLGQMSRSAQLAHIDFVRLAGEEAGSLYFDDLLRYGSAAWPLQLQKRFTGLAGWHGIEPLKTDLKRLACARETSRLLFANRTSQLMQFAARLFFGPCRNVLITDLTWPSYERILRRQAERSGNRLTRIGLRDRILHGTLIASEVIEEVTAAFQRGRCDGLFVPAIDNCGVRLPLEQLVQEIRRRAELRFVVVDGAQAFCHVPLNLAGGFCDLCIAGCHKWLRAYHPMGLGFFGHQRSQGYIEATLARLIESGQLDDPLLGFSEELQHGRTYPFGETVNLAPLFSCRGAVDDVLKSDQTIESRLIRRLANAGELVQVAENAGWTALRPEAALRAGIVLLQSHDAHVRAMKPDALRRRLMQFGVAATTYPQGKVRLSMPERMWRMTQLHSFEVALRLLSDNSSRTKKGTASSALRWNSASSVSEERHS